MHWWNHCRRFSPRPYGGAVRATRACARPPAARDDFEALCSVGAFGDLQRPALDFLQSTLQLGAGIAAIGEYMMQKWIGVRHGLQQVRRAVSILNIDTLHGKANQKPDDIGDDVTLAPFDPLAGVMVSDTATFSGFHALAVDHTRRWGGRALFGLPCRRDKVWFNSSSRPLSRPS